MLDESEFLSPYGIRSLSKAYDKTALRASISAGETLEVDYEPGESKIGLFGGNSNWRGPVWLPLNYLLIEALERYHHFYGDDLRVECPVGSGRGLTLGEVARELSARVAGIFLAGPDGRRACHGDDAQFATDPHWRDLSLFHEYFHGETGRGLGASHQTAGPRWCSASSKIWRAVDLVRDPERVPAPPAKRSSRRSRLSLTR